MRLLQYAGLMIIINVGFPHLKLNKNFIISGLSVCHGGYKKTCVMFDLKPYSYSYSLAHMKFSFLQNPTFALSAVKRQLFSDTDHLF